jgi:hypothetical protein
MLNSTSSPGAYTSGATGNSILSPAGPSTSNPNNLPQPQTSQNYMTPGQTQLQQQQDTLRQNQQQYRQDLQNQQQQLLQQQSNPSISR